MNSHLLDDGARLAAHRLSNQVQGLNRRGFIKLSALGALATAVGLPALLAACGEAAPAASTGAAASSAGGAPAASSAAAAGAGAGAAASKPVAGGSLKLPTYAPLAAIKPDLPGSADGIIDPGFLSYPANPIKSVPNPPGKGGDVTISTWWALAPPTPMDQNPLWQAVNKELNATLKINIVPFGDYQTTRLATIMAGGDIPDILFIAPGAVVPGLPEFLKSKAADLTEYLSGDAVKDYPNLANFPTLSWRNTGVTLGNTIYGVPCPYPLWLWVMWTHQELLDQAGLPQPQNAADFKKALVALTKPDSNQWGIGVENTQGMGLVNGLFSAMFGAPNQWAESGGKLTYTAETDAYRQAVAYARDLYAAGVFTPKSLTYNTQTKRSDFWAKRFAFCFDGFQQASVNYWDNLAGLNPPSTYRVIPPFTSTGTGKPVYWAGQPGMIGTFGYSIIKKGTPERVKELLGILNYIAAPFGSHEHLLMHYGVKDIDYTLDDKGNPALTAKGKADYNMPWPYITQPPPALYYANDNKYPGLMQGFEKSINPNVQLDPTLGLFSPTFASKQVDLTTNVISPGINDIVKGNQPLSAFDQVLKDWKAKGGDQMRGEFESALAASK